MEWGYGGSGPSDLARSILADFAGIKVADMFYQDFKWDFIAKQPEKGFQISGQEIPRLVEKEDSAMIKKVEIQNFQSHKNTVLEFVPGTNVVMENRTRENPPSFELINWVIINRPLGDGFRSIGEGYEKGCYIYLLKEGDVIERESKRDRNVYVSNGKALTAFGSEVPRTSQAKLRNGRRRIFKEPNGCSLSFLQFLPGEGRKVVE